MPSTIGALRRRIFTPSLTEVTFSGRGFPARPSADTEQLEAIPQAVIIGFEWAMDVRDQWEIERRLNVVEPALRGFAYEGATMAFTILDALPGGGRERTRALLLGPGRPHIFLTFIGIGFAMSRLPRPLWSKVVPDLTGAPYYPTLSWLAVDGYGFDRAYFDTRRWVDEQRVPAAYPWDGSPDYYLRVLDQGIGRALWFIHGARPEPVAAAVRRFAEHRRADLWSGVGLAATFAGGTDAEGFDRLRREAVDAQALAPLAQGAVFAAKARTLAGHTPAHTDTATERLAGLSVDAATLLADASAEGHAGSGTEPGYEVWRRRVRQHFLTGADLGS
nr:DUF1702 family protein [Micromonospora sp. DSM 115978]